MGASAIGHDLRDTVGGRGVVTTGVTMPISHQIVRDPKKPGGKRNALDLIAVQVAQGLKERSGSQILGVRGATGPVVHVIVDPPDVPLVQNPEGIAIVPGPYREDFVRFTIHHSKPSSFRWGSASRGVDARVQ